MIRRALAVLAAALVLATSAATAAHADPSWSTQLPCASGGIAAQWIGEDDQGRTTTWLSGTIEPCGPAGEGERFGFVYYVRDREAPGPVGYVFYERLRQYAPGQTTFAGTIDPTVEHNNGALIGVCLAYGPGHLVDCVQPLTDDGPPRPPLPPTHDLAGLPVSPFAPVGTEPNCATCV
ncbi:hypothetical protein ACTMTJ_03945 [Phytohabitans sp. LJ34]|uniref:hypothetical protein n=1 Tax=Phytohabitans sp. LJ34 TaxID=3452217 RepID=UPI003F899F29